MFRTFLTQVSSSPTHTKERNDMSPLANNSRLLVILGDAVKEVRASRFVYSSICTCESFPSYLVGIFDSSQKRGGCNFSF